MMLFVLSSIFICLLLDAFLYHRQKRYRKEPAVEFVFRLLGSNFYFVYVGYRILIQINEYRQFPEAFTLFSWLNWILVLVLFILFGISYLIRATPVSAASRSREIFLPMLCTIMPFGITESVQWSRLFVFFAPFHAYPPGHWNVAAIVLILLGDLLSVAAMIYLRRAFSIMTEARMLVQSGPYHWIRHPIYVGEGLATIGCCLYLLSWFNILLTFLFLIFLCLRSTFEEAKMTEAFPRYADYKIKTGAYFPKL